MTSFDGDQESGITPLLTTNNQYRARLRLIILAVRVSQILFSTVGKAKSDSAIPAKRQGSYSSVSSGDDAEDGVSEFEHPTDHSDCYYDSTLSCEKLQNEKIATMVKEKDLVSLQKFGGVTEIAKCLGTDLSKGISDEDLCCPQTTTTTSKMKSPFRALLLLLLKSSNSYTIFLLSVSAVLSIAFGIVNEDPKTGWLEGIIIFFAIIILVVVPSIRNFLLDNLNSQAWNKNPWEKSKVRVDVLRGGELRKITVGDIVFGDVVCLKKGHLVPGDGLLIPGSGEVLKVEGSSTSPLIINDKNPFIFYGDKVIDGNGHILVTSVGMSTKWSETLSQIPVIPKKNPLLAQLDNVSLGTQIIGLLIPILILVALFLHLKLGQKKHDSGLPDLKEKPKALKRLMDVVERIVIKQNGKISILTHALTMFVGMAEGIPFFVTLFIIYRNKKALSNKGITKETWNCISLGSVTTICTNMIGGLTQNQHEVEMCLIGGEVITEDAVIAVDVVEELCDAINIHAQMPQSLCNSVGDLLCHWATLRFGVEMETSKQHCTLESTKPSSNEEESPVLLKKNIDAKAKCFYTGKGMQRKF